MKKRLVSLVLAVTLASTSLPAFAAAPQEGRGRRFEPPAFISKIIKRVVGTIVVEGDSTIPPIPKP